MSGYFKNRFNAAKAAAAATAARVTEGVRSLPKRLTNAYEQAHRPRGIPQSFTVGGRSRKNRKNRSRKNRKNRRTTRRN